MMDLDLQATALTKVTDIKIPDVFFRRMKTGIETIDSFFHEGILPGSAFTVTAPAGCGKTTWMLQVMEHLQNQGYRTAYCSGEESIYQLAFNCKRLNVQHVSIANMVDVDEVMKNMENYNFIVIDSFQSLTSSRKMNTREFEKYAVTNLVKRAKETECCIAFILHLTKDGKLKGNTLIPHTVDACISIVQEEDSLRNVHFTKNRFGPCNELVQYMGPNGYDFYTEVKKEEEEKKEKHISKPKISQNELIKGAVVQYIIDNTQAQLTQLIQDVEGMENGSKAQRLLRELVAEGKLYKRGFGSSAFWKVESIK